MEPNQMEFVLKCDHDDHIPVCDIEIKVPQNNQEELEYDLDWASTGCIICKYPGCCIDYKKIAGKLISLGWHKD